ncbi:hypothetical protein PSAC2689_20524 [Paraburkholderia sacchari]
MRSNAAWPELAVQCVAGALLHDGALAMARRHAASARRPATAGEPALGRRAGKTKRCSAGRPQAAP